MIAVTDYRITAKAKQRPGLFYPGVGWVEWAKITDRQMARLIRIGARAVEKIPAPKTKPQKPKKTRKQ